MVRHTVIADWYHTHIWNPYYKYHADKAAHFIFLRELTAYMLRVGFPVWSTLMTTILITILNELLDYQERGKFDRKDLLAGWFGILMGFIN
jgi:hypothetical protein